MNARKNRLWKPIDETVKRLGLPRATLYRWIAKGRLGKAGTPGAGVRKVDGFTFLDVYAVAEIIREPRRGRGRMLAIQKVAKEKRIETASLKMPDTLLSVSLTASGLLMRHLKHHDPRQNERDMVADKLEKLAKTIRTGNRFA